MNIKRTATILVAGAALAVWLAAAATSGHREPIGTAVPVKPAIDTRGEDLASEIARLHERLRPAAGPQQPGRNLFSYALRPSPAAPPPPSAPASRPALTETPAASSTAPFKLSGIAEDLTADGTVRTAVISTSGQLFLVKEGESVTARYRVQKIYSDAVELSDLTEGRVVRLAFR